MKNYLLGLLLCLLTFGAQAQVLLGQETFEAATTDVGYTTSTPFAAVYLDPPGNTIASEYFQRINQVPGNTYEPWSSDAAVLGNQQGSYFWGAEGVRGGTNTLARPAGFVQLNGINTAGYNNLTITVAFSAARGNGYPRTFGINGVKREDQVRIEYSFDGTNYTPAGRLTGDAAPATGNSGRWKRDANMSGDASDDTTEPILNMNFTDYQFSVPAIGSLLRVRIVADYNGITASELAFDNIRVRGTLDTTPRPVLALGASESTTPIAYTEGVSGAVQVTNTLAVTYPSGGGTLTGATVQIQSGYVAGQDVLNFTAQNNITGTYTAGTLTLTGTTTLANYQAALRSITYQNTNSTTATGGARTVDFTVRNGTYASNTETRTINVTVTLNAPVPLPYTESLDTDGEGTRYTATTFANAPAQTGFFRTTTNPPTGPGGAVVTSTVFSGQSGAGYWFGEGTIPAPTPKGVLQLAPVDATGRSNIQFTIAIGSGGNWLNYLDSFNPGDSFELFYRINGGTPVKFGAFYGVDGNTPPRQDADLDRLTPAAGTRLGTALQNFTFNLPAAAAVGNLDFMLRLETRGTSEIAFDNIRITGVVPATVATISLGAISNTSATVGGEVTDAGGGTVTERGVVYSATNLTPTIGGSGVTRDANGAGLGQFGRVITGLLPNTTYYVRAYATNAAGAAYGAVETFSTPTFVVSITRDNPNPTNLATVSYTVTFGNNVTGGTASNFSLTTSGLAGAAVASVAGTGATRTVLVNTGTGSGSLTLNMANANGLYPNFSNPFPFAGQPYTVDKTPAAVASVDVPGNGSYMVGQNLNFTVNFTKAVTVTTTGGTPSLGLTVGSTARPATYLSGSGTTALVFRYTVLSGDFDPNGLAIGALALNGGTIQDAAPSNATLTLSGVPATTGILVDGVAPTVTAFTGPAATGSSTGTTPFAFSVSFSESVSDFLAGDIAVTNGTVSSGPTGSGAGPYSFSVTPTTPGTATTVAIAAGAAKDAAGNASTASATYSLTFVPPTVTVSAITGRTPTPTATATVSYRVTFSGSLTGLSTGNFNLTTTGGVSGASVASVSGSGASYVVQVNTGTGDGTLRLNVSTGAGTSPPISGLPTTSGTVYTLVRTNTFVAPQLTIQGSGSASGSTDVTAFVDGVQVLRGGAPVAGALQNGSFETNNVGPTGYTYGPAVSAAPWVFNTMSGVARNGSAFGAATPPQGDAVAFIQSSTSTNGSIAQGLTLPTGSYQVSLRASQRNCCGTGPRDQELYVVVNGVCLGIFQPTNPGGYDPFTSLAFNVRATSRVAGTALRGTGGGTSGYVDFSTNPLPVLGTRYTQAAWVKPIYSGTAGLAYYVLGNGVNTGANAAPTIYIGSAGQVFAGFGSGTVFRSLSTNVGAVASNAWSHVVATFDGTTMRIYVNGELLISGDFPEPPAATPVAYVGSATTSGSAFFPGDFDEVSQWNRALSQTEIRQLRHLTLSGAENGLASYLQFNDSGTTTTDFVSGSVGTLTGSLTRVTGTAPVGYGTSSLLSVTGAGNYDFAGTSAAINFSTPGTPPYDVVVSRLDGPPLGTQPSATGLKNTYAPAYWIVNRYSATAFAATITYTLSPADISPADAAAFAATLRLFKRGSNDDGAFSEVIAANAANAAAGTVSFPVTSFSQTVIGTLGTSPLPVELTRFTAVAQGADALLRWATASEKNNDHFDIEASADGQVFRRIGQVPGHGSSTQAHEYQLVDPALARYAADLVYYRLRQVDHDGTFTYSPVRTVAVDGKAVLALFPNPTTGAATLTGAAPGTVVMVFDALGRPVLAATADAAGTAALALPAGLPTGVYVVRVGTKALRLTVE